MQFLDKDIVWLIKDSILEHSYLLFTNVTRSTL